MLVVGSDHLVAGGGRLALALRVPALVVGLTIVAFGTSTPELFVSVASALSASTEMALANVVGSNIANILLVLGVGALVAPLRTRRELLRRDVPAVVGLQIMVPVLCLDGTLSRIDGILLLVLGGLYNFWLLRDALRGRTQPDLDDLGEEDEKKHTGFYVAQLLFGLVILLIGANFFVNGAVGVAEKLGLSARVIGLTVVALGTSAPEVATAVAASRAGDVDLTIGNSVGSNILNIALVLGTTAVIAPIHLTDAGAWTDMGVAVAASFVLVPMVLRGKHVSRVEGAVMVLVYLAYLGWLSR